jgi:hypothetical protein
MNRLNEQSKRKNKSKEEVGTKSSIPPTIVNNIKEKNYISSKEDDRQKKRQQTIE